MPMRTGTPLPSLEGVETWYNGEPDPDQLKGHPVLVHFWSVSCGQCKDTLSNVLKWKEKYRDQGLQVVGIHMPRLEADLEIGPIEEVIRDYKLEHPQAMDGDYTLVDRFQNQYVPAFYLFDREGHLRHFQAGDRGMKMIRAALDRVIGTASPAGTTG
jgi:thiol-disulfide isomerase/thioredoxin